VKHTVISTGKFYKGVTRELKSPVQTDKALTYEVGEVVSVAEVDEDPAKDCGKGINFCRTIAEALCFGPVVLEISVPERTKIIDTGGKLRATKVKVEARANLARANLARAYLAGANLAGANLARANLAGANLAGAYLARAYLAGANLAGANLARANLVDANLASADLAGANLAGANLAGARGDKYTILPTGWKVDDDSGLIVEAK
jgi:hypothetical protein